MVLEILAILGGAVTRFAPAVMEHFKQGRDLKYELLRMEKEVGLEKQRGVNTQAEILAASSGSVDTSWVSGLVEALKGQAQVTGDKWLDRLNVSVRPILTYWWCIAWYSGAKMVLIAVGVQEGMPLAEFAEILLTEFDRAIVGSIIGFWFVDRALRRGGK